MKRILIIEDDHQTAQVIEDILHATTHYEIIVSTHGQTGIQIAQAQLPDLVICDIMMPEVDGYDVLAALRSEPETRPIPVIFLTAKDQRGDLRRGMELGAADYIPKPFKARELLKAIETRLAIQDDVAHQYETTMRQLRQNIIYALPHELRTPLTSILGFSEMLLHEEESLSAAESREMAQSIFRAGERLKHLFENYLIYAQMELLAANPEQARKLRSHITRDAALIIGAQAEQQADIANRRADLALGSLVHLAVPMSTENLEKVVGELVNNAFKFSPAGTPVEVSTARVEQPDGFVLTVHDYGRGMTANARKRIGAYMQFQRLLQEQQGVGLGLAIVRRLVELHKGDLHIESTPGAGTTVRVTLPFQ